MNNRALVFLAAGLLALGLLFAGLRPENAPPPAPATSAPAAGPAASGTPSARTFELRVEKGALVSGPAVLEAMEGEPVILRVTSDADDELHLHGYDLSLSLKAGTPGSLAFTADKTGRFEYELHHAHASLGALEVRPR